MKRPLCTFLGTRVPRSLLLTIAMLSMLSSIARADRPAFQWNVQTNKQLQLTEHNNPVLVFQLETKSLDGRAARANYVHPLYGPTGQIVTEDFPKDHVHHRGIFWAWHQLLLDGKPLADPWVCKDVSWQVPDETGCWVETSASDDQATMKVVRDWAVPSPEDATRTLRVVRETVQVTAWPSSDSLRILDFDLRLRALLPGISIGGSTDVKGYGGFSTRIRLADDVTFRGQAGAVKPKPLAAVEGGAWVDLVRTLDGQRQGVAILVHPSHPDFPLRWILRPKGSAQNPEWPGRQAVPVSTDADLRLRYCLALHTGDLDHDAIEELWQQFAER